MFYHFDVCRFGSVLMLCLVCLCGLVCFFFFKQKTAYEMRISDWSSDVCSSDLSPVGVGQPRAGAEAGGLADEAFVEHPGLGRGAHEGLVVEAGGDRKSVV